MNGRWTEDEAGRVMSMAIGRLFQIASRPTEPGDEKQFFDIRAAVLDAAECLGIDTEVPNQSWAANRLRGAQGDQ